VLTDEEAYDGAESARLRECGVSKGGGESIRVFSEVVVLSCEGGEC
jgi:hypothetical protein